MPPEGVTSPLSPPRASAYLFLRDDAEITCWTTEPGDGAIID